MRAQFSSFPVGSRVKNRPLGVNKAPTQIEDIKLGIINKPLNEYASEFESGLIDCGEFQAGTPTEKSDTLSTIDCGTYNPLTDQDTVVDADLYINA